jgi:hypothetical protein
VVYVVSPHEFDAVTLAALRLARTLPEPYAGVLRLLGGLYAERAGRAWAAQGRGASYKALALIAHKANMSKAERQRWYRIAESIPLAERHASYIIARLGRAPP